MSDLPDRLRRTGNPWTGYNDNIEYLDEVPAMLPIEAADRIDALTAEVAALTEQQDSLLAELERLTSSREGLIIKAQERLQRAMEQYNRDIENAFADRGLR